jgi:membrane protease YdiL (CAAX protease family)
VRSGNSAHARSALENMLGVRSLNHSQSAIQPSIWDRISHWTLGRIFIMAVMLLVVVIVTPRVLNLGIPREPSPWHSALIALRHLLVAGAMVWIYSLSVKLMERRSAIEVKPRALHLLTGALIGSALITAVYVALRVTGHASFAPGTGMDGLGVALAGVFAAALAEELLLRAILFRIAQQAFGTTAAVILSAVIFGLLHGLNPGATLMTDVAIALEAGILLALAYALTRNLWFAVGIHLGWNFAEGNIYGAAVSGTASVHTFLRVSLSGTETITGGTFGPEASIFSIAVCLVASGALLLFVIRKHLWIPVGFRLSLP